MWGGGGGEGGGLYGEGKPRYSIHDQIPLRVLKDSKWRMRPEVEELVYLL